MSKSKKRFIVRLSLVTVVLVLGVYALVQAQGGMGAANAPAREDSGNKPDESTGRGNPADATSGRLNSQDGQSPATARSQQAELPSPQESVIRGQNGGEFQTVAEDPAAPKPGRFQPRADFPLNQPDGSRSHGGGQFQSASPILPPSAAAPVDASVEQTQPRRQTSVLAPPKSGPDFAAPIADAQSQAAEDLGGSDEGEHGSHGEPAPPRASQPPSSAGPAVTIPPSAKSPTADASYGDDSNVSGTDQGFGAAAFDTGRSSMTASGTPGPAHLEGVRSPSIAMEKRVPSEIQVGKPAIFEIRLQNVGRVDAENVTVLDEVPAGTRFVDASPEPAQAAQGQLLWQLGTLEPGEETTISIQLMPLQEGEIGSVARVVFESQASARTVCTRPQLAVEVAAAPRVLIGEDVTLAIRVFNPGTGAATGVIVEEDVPDGFSHAAGNELEFEIGTLRPGESQDIQLTLTAEQAGQIENVLLARGDGNLIAQDAAVVEVIAPQLALETSGPAKRYLERQATYAISVANRGTAPANDVEVVAYLHKGMKFIETNNYGQYDAQSHAVFWSLEELPAKDAGTVELTVLPVETGQQKLRVEGRAKLGLEDAKEHLVSVEGLAALFFEVADVADPIEVGSDTVYQIRVLNQGSKTATDIQIEAILPPELQPIGGDGATSHRVAGQRVIFEPLARLAPKGNALFKVQARGLAERDPRVGQPKIRVQLTSHELPNPVIKEESTRVYVDQ